MLSSIENFSSSGLQHEYFNYLCCHELLAHKPGGHYGGWGSATTGWVLLEALHWQWA
jgi:hypothetical protein